MLQQTFFTQRACIRKLSDCAKMIPIEYSVDGHKLLKYLATKFVCL